MIALSQTGHFLRGLFILLVVVGFIGWIFWRILKNSRDPQSLLLRCFASVALLVAAYFSIDKLAGDGSAAGQIAGLLAGLVFSLFLAALWLPAITSFVSDLFGNLYTGGTESAPPEPHYSIADARIKRGRYREAIYEIQRELAKFPTDITGHMKLAEIQAQHLSDLPAAQLTIERFLNQPGHPPPHIAYALNTLADWQLKLHDVDAARGTLGRIALLLPGTEQANIAAQRLSHLASKEHMLSAYDHRPIHLPSAAPDLGLSTAPPEGRRRAQESPEEQAQRLVQHLEQYPLDNEAREQLAHLYAEHYQQPDLAIGQLEELLNAPHQSGKEITRWLNTIADLQLKSGADYNTVRATLERIIERFGGLAAAELAHQRLEYLRLEFKGKEKSHTIPLGTYEKDLGLKSKPPLPPPP